MFKMKLYTIVLLYVLKTYSAKEFRLGLLSPYSHPRLGWTNNAAAVTIAIEKAQSEGLLKDHNITVRWRDDKCNNINGAGNAVLLRDVDDVDVYIGPPCSSATEPAGLLASFWNFPMFSQASSDPTLADKSVFKTLVRLGPPFNKLGNVFVEIFNHFNWRRVVMISRRKTDNKKVFCDYSSRSAEAAFRNNNITVADWIIIDDGISDLDINILLNRVKERGRIIILCSENSNDKRRILLKAHDKGMMNADYVYFTPDHLPPANVEKPWKRGDAQDDVAKEAFMSVFQITVAEMAGADVEAFRNSIPTKMGEHPWNFVTTQKGSEYSPFLHDVVYLYLLCLNETLAEGGQHRNGTLMFNKAKGKQFRGITGNVKVDSNGDREPDYWLWDMEKGGNKYEVAIEARMTSDNAKKIHIIKTISWNTDDGQPPLDSPTCGFFGEKCTSRKPDNTVYIITGSIVALVLIAFAIVAVIFYRKSLYEKQLEQMLWKVAFDEITIKKERHVGSISQLSLHNSTVGLHSEKSVSELSSCSGDQVFASLGVYKNTLVTIHRLTHGGIALTRKDLMELKAMRELRHENVNSFLGMCLDDRCPCILTAYCSKGSLEDIIENDDIKLEWMFKVSLLTDLVNGMNYIHNSPLKLHGNLKSSNCVVDNRWVLKITDFGIANIRQKYTKGLFTEYQKYRGMFWTSPENLPVYNVVRGATKKGDVYSFGIIAFEIIYRTQPYDTNLYTPNEIIKRVKSSETPAFRPTCNTLKDTKDSDVETTVRLMKDCWTELPDDRPTFLQCKQQMLKLSMGRKTNVVDNMITMLEKYANNLEEIVEHRTNDLIQEKKKTDALLYRMLPQSVAERLKVGEDVVPELFDRVTIYFSDIVGFTSLASESTAIEIVDFLNDLYTSFDGIISQFDVYKVETIGDAYMVVSGLPIRNGNNHSSEIANMAIALLASLTTFKVKHKPEKRLQLRIGIHSGPCAAGVVGLTMPRYCLFGDTVNMASRMESNGEALKIHLSEDAHDALSVHPGYRLVERGTMEIKGKGMQTTYWLTGKDDCTLQVPPETHLNDI